MSNFRWFNLIVSLFFLMGLSSFQQDSKTLKEGLWRGVFTVPGNEIPFVFEVKETSAGNASVFLMNGEDRFQLKNIAYKNDSVSIPIDLYDAVLKGKLTVNTFEGRLIKGVSGKPDAGVPFKAEYGKLPRFPESTETPVVSLGGTWDMVIGTGEQAEKTVGIFDQKKSLLTGSILTTTGDYRFLEGVVHGKKFELSAFGGSTPYLIKGEFADDNTFTGEFVTPRNTIKLEGKRNAKAALPDAYNVTYLKQGYSSVSFTFPNLEGKQVSLSDPVYKGKVVIVTILGSWCPNCLDENKFLSGWYKENHNRGVEIIGLGFERKNDFESAKKSLTALKTRLGIEYEILFAGQSGTESASKALPQLNGIASFPTTIFIDKKGNVRKIHSGFSGPATGKFFEEFKTEFNALINQLVAE
jgi:thiol-disulfide isomerase/thioredoxin